MTLLVAGAVSVDAGKTTFATGLVEHAGAVGFKPRAGNDYWFDHDDVRRVVDQGRLCGADATRLAAASPGTPDPEEINPVHRLWRPSSGPGQGVLGQTDREFLVDRAGGRFVVNGTVDVPAPLREALPLADAPAVSSTAELNAAIERVHLPALDTLAERIASTDRAVVESYGDVARPIRAVEPEAVAVVEPLELRVYRGSRFLRACEVASRSPYEGQLEERVASVEELVEPEHEVDLPPLDGETREDPAAVADAYRHAYETVLTVTD
jgi:predicted P-loop ATPase/GTPase